MLKEPEKTPGAGHGAVEEKRPLVVWDIYIYINVGDEMLPSYVRIIS